MASARISGPGQLEWNIIISKIFCVQWLEWDFYASYHARIPDACIKLEESVLSIAVGTAVRS